MLELATPASLAALGALLVPILIHLVRRPQQVVRLGSLRFLRQDRFRVSSLRWRQWLLLVLRCATLAVLALMLAVPRWRGTPEPARWLLLTPTANLDATAQAEWERLKAEGFETRWLAPGFPTSSESPPAMTEEIDAWSLLREADARLAAGSKAMVFGPTPASHFRGSRPALSRVEVTWRLTPAVAMASPVMAKPAVRVALLASEDRAEDARYLRAAFAAIGGVVLDDRAPDWIFHLGAAPLPPGLRERVEFGALLVTDPANDDPRHAEFRRFDVGSTTVNLRQRVALNRGAPVLLDSRGDALCTEEKQGHGRRWRFALRFHPEWSDWPLESSFPAWWRAHFFPPGLSAQTIAAEQAAPGFAPAARASPPPLRNFAAVDLRASCWALALGLFLLERALSASPRRRRIA